MPGAPIQAPVHQGRALFTGHPCCPGAASPRASPTAERLLADCSPAREPQSSIPASGDHGRASRLGISCGCQELGSWDGHTRGPARQQWARCVWLPLTRVFKRASMPASELLPAPCVGCADDDGALCPLAWAAFTRPESKALRSRRATPCVRHVTPKPAFEMRQAAECSCWDSGAPLGWSAVCWQPSQLQTSLACGLPCGSHLVPPWASPLGWSLSGEVTLARLLFTLDCVSRLIISFQHLGQVPRWTSCFPLYSLRLLLSSAPTCVPGALALVTQLWCAPFCP